MNYWTHYCILSISGCGGKGGNIIVAGGKYVRILNGSEIFLSPDCTDAEGISRALPI